MSNVVKMYPEPDRAERLMDDADAGGIGVYVQFDSRHGSSLLFNLHDGATPTAAGMAAIVEIAARFKANADFRDAVERSCVHLGSAVQYVEEPAWTFRPLTPAETAALYAEEGA